MANKSIDCAYSVRGLGPTIFFVHGIGARKTTWNGVIKYLENDFRCVTYDLRGHGESPKGLLPYSLEVLVEDLEALRRKTNTEKMHIVGHSLGGMIGPAYARKYPKSVNSVCLLSTAAFRTNEDREKIQAVIKSMKEKGIGRVLGTLTDRWFTDEFIENSPADVERRLEQVMETDAEVLLEVFRIYSETEMSPWLDEIMHPCLVLTGEKDGGCNPRLNNLIADRLPNSELCILKHYKHSLLVEAPEKVGEKIYKFLVEQFGLT
jgi:pimeloyl-ACP methyl ester carboxylesterase